ncbi:MAG: molybdopterin dinucleotide binding domain-containing protein [Planctomycetota bacterium]
MHCSLACDLAVAAGAKDALVPDYPPAEGSRTRGRLCFRGHYVSALAGHGARLSSAWVHNGSIRETSPAEAVKLAAVKLRDAARANSLAVLVDGNFPCEETAKAVSFARERLQCSAVAVYVPPADEELLKGLGDAPTVGLEKVSEAATVLAVGDVFSTHPVLAGFILDAIGRTKQGKLLAIDSTIGRTMRFAAKGYLVRPGTEGALLAAIARAAGARPDGHGHPEETLAALSRRTGVDEGAAAEIVSDLRATPGSVVAISLPAGRVDSPAACAAALAAIGQKGVAQILPLCASGNARGALAVATALGAMPFGNWLSQLLTRPAAVILCIGTDLLGSAPGGIMQAIFGGADTVIAAASMPSATTARADIILPLAGWYETAGTLISPAGERISFGALSPPPGGAPSPGELADELAGHIEGPTRSAAGFDVARLDTALPTPTGLEADAAPVPDGGFVMVSRTEHYELPEPGVSRQLAWVRLMECEPVAVLGSADAEGLGLRRGDSVRVSGADGSAELRLDVSDAVPPGVMATPLGLGSTKDLFPWKVRANGLVGIGPASARIVAAQSSE